MANRTKLSVATVAITVAFLGGMALAASKAPGPLGLPSVETLQEKLSLTAPQAKHVELVYADYKDKAKEAEDKADAPKMAALRREIVDKIKQVFSPSQQQKLDEIVSQKA